jgi:hypothetical protein
MSISIALDSFTISEYERRKRVTPDDVDEVRQLLKDFCATSIVVPDFTFYSDLLRWQRQVIIAAIDGHDGRDDYEETAPIKTRGRKRKITVDDFKPHYKELEESAFSTAAKNIIAERLGVSLSTISILVNELRYGVRKPGRVGA